MPFSPKGLARLAEGFSPVLMDWELYLIVIPYGSLSFGNSIELTQITIEETHE